MRKISNLKSFKMEAIFGRIWPKIRAHTRKEMPYVTEAFSRMRIADDTEPLVGKSDTPTSYIKDKLSEDMFLSILKDQEVIECRATLTDCNINVFDLIKEHDCFLNIP